MSEFMFTEHNLLRDRAVAFFQKIQDDITSTLSSVDGISSFREDKWERPGGGGGRTRILADGAVFEKAGVNFSAVHGESPKLLSKGIDGLSFFASGTSLVIHPHSPKVPTIHANFRFFQQSNGDVWFGGGIDLTPYYLDEDDVRQFHTTLKEVCDRHDSSYYPRFKKWCDEYFYIKHRGETRGVGGLFFDHLTGNTDEAAGLDLPNISGSGFLWDISQFTTNGSIAIVVPEPSRAAFLLVAGLAVFLRRSRYRS